jgi:stage III sporulation protein AB
LLKQFALGLVFLACGSAGAFYARGMMLRVKDLENAMQMLASLRAQLQFSRPPLERMLGEVCAGGQPPSFLPHVLQQMRAGAAFPAAWRAAVAQRSPALREEDRARLFSLGELLGASDAAGQREALLLQETLLQSLLDQARERRNSRGRAMFTLGILAGLTVMILFL